MAATLTDEARKQGKAYIERLLDEWEVPPGVRKDLLTKNTTLKSCAVVRLRRQLARTLWGTCWQDHRQRPENFLINYTSAVNQPPWYHLSTTNIAHLLKVTHGAVVRVLKRTAKPVAFACYKPKVAGYPEVTVRRFRDAGGDEPPEPLKPEQTLGEEIIDGLRELTQRPQRSGGYIDTKLDPVDPS